jgi:hypothetical protein
MARRTGVFVEVCWAPLAAGSLTVFIETANYGVPQLVSIGLKSALDHSPLASQPQTS